MKYFLCLFFIAACQNLVAQEKNFEWTNHTLVFQNDLENEVAYIDFGDNQIWGWIEITLTASYSHRLATGKYTKRFSIGKNKGNEGYFYQNSEVPEAFDKVAAQWKIGKLEKGPNGNLRLPIYHIDTKRNSLLVAIKGNSLTPVNTTLFSVIDPVILVNTETRDYVYFKDTNVGIGIEKPTEKLHVKGNTMLEGNTIINQYSPRIFLRRNTGEGGFIQGIQTQLQDKSPNFYFGNLHSKEWIIAKGEYSDTRLFTVKSNGDVGIGIENPTEKLHVNGSSLLEGNTIIKQYSPRIFLRRNTDEGGFIQGIQTQLKDESPNFYFGNLHSREWIITKGEYNGNRLFTVKSNGEVGIGTSDPAGWKLAVNGEIRAKEIKVETGWSDFVFQKDYKLPTLQEVEEHIKDKGHLKDIPSAKEVEENGVFLGEMDSKLLQKIEELMLYTIQQNKRINVLEEEIKSLRKN